MLDPTVRTKRERESDREPEPGNRDQRPFHLWLGYLRLRKVGSIHNSTMIDHDLYGQPSCRL